MPIQLDFEKSEGIADQLSYIRVWPGGVHGIYKRFRYVMRV